MIIVRRIIPDIRPGWRSPFVRAFSGSAGLLREKYFNWSSQNHFLAFEGNISIFPRKIFQYFREKYFNWSSQNLKFSPLRVDEASKVV